MRGKVFLLIGLLVISTIMLAQGAAPIITTIAGGGPNNIPAIYANVKRPSWLTVDPSGRVFVSSPDLTRVFVVQTDGTLNIAARSLIEDPTGINPPLGVTSDNQGNLYIGSYRYIYRLDAITGVISTVAGDGSGNYTGEGVPATATGMTPQSVYWKNGNLYFCDTATFRLRVINSQGLVYTLAGNGSVGYAGEGVTANTAPINACFGIALDSQGKTYFSEGGNRVRVINSNVLNTYAGDGTQGYFGDGGFAVNAKLSAPQGLVTDINDDLYIVDSGNNVIRKVTSADLKISTIAGTGAAGFQGDGNLATFAQLNSPNDIAINSTGDLYIADSSNNRVRKIDSATTFISTAYGDGAETVSGDGYPATDASLFKPYVVAVLPTGQMLISDSYNSRLRIVTADGMINTFAGTTYGPGGASGGDGGPATSAQMMTPAGFAVAADGSIYVADIDDNRIRKIDTNGTITTVVGDGTPASTGDGGLAKDAQVNAPADVVFDANGNFFISEAGGNRIRMVNQVGIISTVAGIGGAGGFNGDGKLPLQTQFYSPTGFVIDSTSSVIYLADADNGRIRKIDFKNNVVSTVAGDPNGVDADGILATRAMLMRPTHVTFDASGTMYIADQNSNKVRTVSNGYINTLAGTGIPAAWGDNGPALSAQLNQPTAVGFDVHGNVLIADSLNNRIRKVQLSTAETIPPILTVDRNPLPNSTGWSNQPVQYTLTATDTGGSGVKEIYYELTGSQTGSQNVAGSRATFSVSVEGLTTVRAYATDNAGNVSLNYSQMVGVDLTPPNAPSVTVTPTPDANGWTYAATTVTFTPKGDPGAVASGVFECTSPVTLTQSTLGTPVSGTCTDYGGNVSQVTSVVVKIQLPQADIVLSADRKAYPTLTDPIRYIVKVTNNGPSDAHNVQVTDSLTRMTVANVGAGSGTCTKSGSSATCTWATMLNQGSDTMWVEVTAPSSGWAMHEFTSSADETDPNHNNSTLFVNPEIANNTKTGANIIVADGASNSSVVFDNVSTAGITSLKAAAAQSLPTGYRLGSMPLIFDATTSAGYTGLVTINLDIRSVVFRHPATVRLFKWEAGAWYDITAGLNLSAGVVSGRTGSLTRFGVFEMNDRAPVATAIDRVIPSQSSTGMAVTLDGTHSSDADGDTLTYRWTGAFPEGNGTVTGATPTVTLPMGLSPITLIVNDGEVDSAPMATTVTVSGFKITAPVASASVQRGQSATFEIQVSPQYGAFEAPVVLACPSIPASMTCKFSEASITPGSSGSKVVLTIGTAQSASLRSRYTYTFAFLLPASFLLIADRKRRRSALLGLLGVALLAFLVACGSSGYVSVNNGQLTAQVTVQSVTVTGTSGGLASSTGLTVTVQP